MRSAGDIHREMRTEVALPTSAPSGLASPWEQRILQLEGKRYSLRLEHEFWTALEAIASRRKLRLNRVVAEIASHRSDENNLSSLLRVFCLGEMGRGATGRALAPDRASIAALIQAAPAPGLLLDTEQRVLAVNAAFLHWSGLERVQLLRQNLAAHFRLESASSFEGLWARPTREEQTRLIRVVPERGLAAKAKLVPLLSARGRRLCVVWVIA